MTRQPSGFVIWLTGLPASGKSSLALALKKELACHHIHTIILDANELRPLLTPEPEYTDGERQWLYKEDFPSHTSHIPLTLIALPQRRL